MQKRGDVTLVADMTAARGMNKGKGYSKKYVRDVLKGRRNNKKISKLHQRIISLRTRP